MRHARKDTLHCSLHVSNTNTQSHASERCELSLLRVFFLFQYNPCEFPIPFKYVACRDVSTRHSWRLPFWVDTKAAKSETRTRLSRARRPMSITARHPADLAIAQAARGWPLPSLLHRRRTRPPHAGARQKPSCSGVSPLATSVLDCARSTACLRGPARMPDE